MSYTILNSSITPNILGLGGSTSIQNGTYNGQNTIISTTPTTQESFPIGTITQYLGSIPPVSWLICNGSTFNQLEYPDLYTFLNNSNVLPDLRGQILKGTNNQLSLGQFQLDQNKEHLHTIQSIVINSENSQVQNQNVNISGSTNPSPISLRVNDNAGANNQQVLEYDEFDGSSVVTQNDSLHTHSFNAVANIPLQQHNHQINIPQQQTQLEGGNEVRVKSFGINYIIKASVNVAGTSPAVSVLTNDKIQDNSLNTVVQANINNVSINQPLTMNNKQIIDVLDPINSQDASTKNYVDQQIQSSYLQQQAQYQAADGVLQTNYQNSDAILQANINQVQTNLNNAILSGCLDSIVQLDDNTRTLTIQNGDLIATNIDNFDLTGVNVIGLDLNSDQIISNNLTSKLLLDQTLPKANLYAQNINEIDFTNGVNKIRYDNVPSTNDELTNKLYVDTQINTHTHDQIEQNSTNYVRVSGNTVETVLFNNIVHEITSTNIINPLPYNSIQSLTFTPSLNSFLANSMVTRNFVINLHQISSFNGAVGDSMPQNTYLNIIDENQTVMRHVANYQQITDFNLSFGNPVVFDLSQSRFEVQTTGLYRVTYQLSYIIDPQTQANYDSNLAIPVSQNTFPYSTFISCFYNLTDQQVLNANCLRTDMASINPVDRSAVFDHNQSFVTYLSTAKGYRLLSPVFRFGTNVLQAGRTTYVAIQFELIRK